MPSRVPAKRKPIEGSQRKSPDRHKPLPLETQVHQALQKSGMIRPKDHVLVAVSGGADSTALLLCLHQLVPSLRVKLSAAHLNHGIRRTEADEDEEFVRKLCAKLQIPLISESVEVKKSARAHGKNLEEAAREARYEFLQRVATSVGANKIALGHNLNDQAETVLMRLIRGSGTDGLASIRPALDNLFIRPLLECRRLEIVQYLSKRGAIYRLDSTNKDLSYHRNRVRQELIPYLERHFNPKLIEALGRHAKMAREISDYLETQARGQFESIRTCVPGGISIQAQKLLELHPALQRTILRCALRDCRGSLRGIVARHIDQLLSLCLPGHSGRRIQLPGKCVAIRQFESLLFFHPEAEARPPFSYELPLPGHTHVAELGLDFLAIVDARRNLSAQNEDAQRRVCLDADALPKSLIIRSRRPGDRYGSSSRKKVKKMLIDARIPLRSRATLPMVVAGDVVVWIPGFRPAKSVAVQPQSMRCVVLEIRSHSSAAS